MSRSPKRSLAAIASFSLVIAGIGLAVSPSATANSVQDQVNTGGAGPNGVQIYTSRQGGADTQPGTTLSTRSDGTDTSIRLVAGGGSNVTGVKFQYRRPSDPTIPAQSGQPAQEKWVDVSPSATLRNGVWTSNWSPNFREANVQFRALAILNDAGADAAGAAETPALASAAARTKYQSYATTAVKDQFVATVEDATGAPDTVALADLGGTLGYFKQPYGGGGNDWLAAISGTSSAPSETNISVDYFGNGTEVPRPESNGASALGRVTRSDVAAPTGSFATILKVQGQQGPASVGYPFAAGTNQIVVEAFNDTDDVQSYELYEQRVATSTVTAVPTSSGVVAGGSSTVTVTVLDAQSKPVAGVRVHQIDVPTNGAEPIDDDAGPTVITDAFGKATFTQPIGKAYYFANAENDMQFNNNIDKRSSTVQIIETAKSSLLAESQDGPAFDTDEYALGDIRVSVRDQAGRLVADGGTISYTWDISPFASGLPFGNSSSGTAPIVTTAGDPNRYYAVIPLPSNYASKAGSYELRAQLDRPGGGTALIPSRLLTTLKQGESAIRFAKSSPESYEAGTTGDVQGTLVLADGTGLPGRTLNATYTRGIESGAVGDAGIGANRSTAGSVETTPTGAFTVPIVDAVKQSLKAENGGSLRLTGAAPNQDATAEQGVNFIEPVPVGKVEVAPESSPTGGKTPGRPVASSVKVTKADGTAIANKAVVLNTDKGFFTDGTSASGTAAGNDAGNLTSLGSSITVTTNAQGVANFSLAIGRDTGFDDDGKVDATVTASSGGQSDTEVVDWTTANPLNGGRVRLELAPANLQESTVLPKAPISDDVAFDVVVEDQFANPVGGETVTITDNTSDATTSVTTVTSDFVKDADVTATATAATNQTVTASWTTETSKYNSAVPAAAVAGTETLTSAYTVTWYVVDPAASTVTFTSNKATADPGTSVTTTYTAKDQFGEAISDLYVQFFRNGPGSEGGSAPAAQELLGQDGVATFAFTGNSAGSATVNVVGRVGTATGAVVTQAAKTLTVTFAGGKADITPLIGAQGRGGKADKVAVYEPAAVGATVKLYRLKGNDVTLVAIKTLDAQGLAIFEIADRNKRRRTNYAAIVEATSTTKQGVTEIVKPR